MPVTIRNGSRSRKIVILFLIALSRKEKRRGFGRAALIQNLLANNFVQPDFLNDRNQACRHLRQTVCQQIRLAQDTLAKILKMLEMLEENDDVQNVWHNAELPEEEEEE